MSLLHSAERAAPGPDTCRTTTVSRVRTEAASDAWRLGGGSVPPGRLRGRWPQPTPQGTGGTQVVGGTAGTEGSGRPLHERHRTKVSFRQRGEAPGKVVHDP